MHEKYGSVVTTSEMILVDLIESVRRTNELLEKMFMLQQKPLQTVKGTESPKDGSEKPSAEELKAMGGAPKGK